jgi:hypothetical protein
MSSTAARKLTPLNLVLDTRVHPERRETHSLMLRLSRDEFSSLLDFTHAVKKRTGQRVTQQSIGRAALLFYLRRHSAWTDCLPDRQAAG